MDKFRIISKIGHGSYGQVWLVKHKKDKKHYVLKQISLQNASQREIRAAHLEVQLLASLRHPNIVCYRDAFKSGDSLLFIAMSYCEGGDLYKKIKEQKGIYFQEIQVVEWFIQICMALQYLHDRNILHRDLKTQNIFLTRSKVIKVGDLGIAKVLDSESAMATTLIGTPYYMSPELFSNKPYNHKSDVWALGCCIYEIATLRHAFNANDINALMYKILRGKLPCMPRQYSAELINLIRAMLNQNPEQRPAVSKILRDPFVKKNIAVFLEGTKVSMRHDMPSSPGQKKPEVAQLSSGGKVQQVCEDVIIRQVVGKQVNEANAVQSKLFSEKNRHVDFYLKGQNVFQLNNYMGVDANNHISNELQAPLRNIINECKGHKVARSPRISSSRSASSEECNEDISCIEEVISSNLVITGSEIKLEERPLDNLGEQKKSPRRTKHVPPENPSDLQRRAAECEKTLLLQPDEHFQNVIDVEPFQMNCPATDKNTCLASVHSVAVSEQSCDAGADLNEPVKRTNVKKLPNARRLKRVKKRVIADDEPSAPSFKTSPSIDEKEHNIESDVQVQYPVIASCQAEERSASHNLVSQSVNCETNRQNVSARQRRRAKLKQELESSGENEVGNNISSCKSKDAVGLNEQPVPIVCETEMVQNENHVASKHKNDEDLSALLTLLDITLHDERSASAEDDPQECSPHKPGYDTDTRLKSRIKMLHRDCVNGLGVGILSEALQMLNNYSSLELETKLQNLLGMAKFVQFIGKIWQLKFCQDSVESGEADRCDT